MANIYIHGSSKFLIDGGTTNNSDILNKNPKFGFFNKIVNKREFVDLCQVQSQEEHIKNPDSNHCGKFFEGSFVPLFWGGGITR